MRRSRILIATLLGFCAAAASTDGVNAQEGAGFGRLGAFRTQLGEVSQGLSVSVTERLHGDSNLVRTSSDAETQLLYNTPDSTDFVSQTSVNATYVWDGNRSSITLSGDAGYAKYFEFDQFSGFVAGLNGRANWQFTDRCSTGADAGIERRLVDFANIASPDGNFQDEFRGDVEVGCFVLERVRLSGGVFGASVRNDETAIEIADIDWVGFRLMAALVSVKKNEIGVRFEQSETTRPNDPTAETIENQRIEGYVLYRPSNKFQIEAAVGNNTESRDTGPDTDRSSARVDFRYAPTDKLSTRIGFDRGITDSQDLVGTTRESDQIRGDLNWRVARRISTGVYAVHTDDTLNAGVGGVLTGVNETITDLGAYAEHTLFNRASLRWTAGYSERDSDFLARDYESIHGGVTIGVGF